MAAFHVTIVLIYRLCLIQLIVVALLAPALAQVTTMITPDASLGTTVTPNGNVFEISDGTQQGPNLFHSFDRFDVGTGDTARFTGPQTGINNILGRVTGGQQSLIDGTLQADMAGADLYLINPSGVMLGPNARLDVRGSFHISTADVVRLEDGGVFVANRAMESVLSVAGPVAFGFLRENPSGIRIEESVLVAPSGQTLFVVGGDIDIVGGPRGILIAPSGQIHLTAVTSPGDVMVDFSEPGGRVELQPAVADGAITLSDFAVLDVRDDVGGSIRIRGGHIELTGGSILIADSTGSSSRQPGGITLEATDMIILTDGSRVESESTGRSAAGRITITSRNLRVQDGSHIAISTFGDADGSMLTVRVSEDITLDNGFLFANTLPLDERDATGSAGTIIIEARNVRLTSGAQINSASRSIGDGGMVIIRAREDVVIVGSDPMGKRSSGVILDVRGGDESPGSGGSVLVEAQNVLMSAGARIQSETEGRGAGGNIVIRVSGDVLLEGESSPEQPTSLLAGSKSKQPEAGAAGSILVEAQNVILREGAQVASVTFGPGRGGIVTIRARRDVTLERSVVFANTEGKMAGAGTAGFVTVEAQNITLNSRAQIGSASFGTGHGGEVTVRARETLLLEDENSGILGTAQGVPEGSGSAGSLLVEAKNLRLASNAQIASATAGAGQGGEVVIRVGQTLTLDGGDIFARALALGRANRSGSAGAVTIETQNLGH